MTSASSITIFFIALFALAGCAKSSSTELSSRSIDAYCPYSPSKQFASPVTVTGTAVYEYRQNGNGVASDGGVVLTIDSYIGATARTYSITINSRTYSVQSSLDQTAGQKDVVSKLKALIAADRSSGLYAYGIAQLTITQPAVNTPPVVTAPTRMIFGLTNPLPRPIRFAEVAVKDSNGVIAQCAETRADGSFTFELPRGTGNYTVEVRSRAKNARSYAYVLDNPDDNMQHAVTSTVQTDDSSSLFVRARVHEGSLGGAFNILDQLLNAQDYLRAETAGCNDPTSANFFPGCVPFLNAPLVSVYWSPGVSPGIYVGTTGSISFYLNGKRELYLQGGENGNITSSDMDQFDNSVIIHEYAHFLEDVYGRPDSPGGSHNGDSIIDPRLAWGEGWANFFQAAVTGDPTYRDTYGTPDCNSSCAGTYFNASIDPSGTPANDAPTPGADGEGNFREFAVTRMLWDVVKPNGGVSRFAEIWRSIVAVGTGMHDIDDPFKTVGRFHGIQSQLASPVNWSSIRQKEGQVSGLSPYATPIRLAVAACGTPMTMNPQRSPGDNGSFATSDQFRNNDFLRFNHQGGAIDLELFYSKDTANSPDLDLYLYKSRYVFGRVTDMLLSSAFTGDGCPASGTQSDPTNPFRAQNGCPTPPSGVGSTFGYEKASVTLAAGTYMINVQADTTSGAGASTSYVILLNGQPVCPTP